ncbi:hypothetical protein M422DRAFT_70571 [Sphaerobolus stellatus SS14]|uniref:F-box domain-containing protein n=1 Tax=Sphaerobolus stellatus (strain SS14) TaxID=990650 RepID=A0A0C9TQK4_SPHS4|nr:hypothetical protein M422DRAFT_70571 [Sphaerobolus stellatus SS14]
MLALFKASRRKCSELTSESSRSLSSSVGRQPTPHLPAEIVLKILTFLCDASDVPTIERGLINRKNLSTARVCRAWYFPAMFSLYTAVAPSSLRSCRALLCTLLARPDLAERVISITIPKDDKLILSTVFSSKLTASRTKIIRKLLQICPNVADLRLPIDAALWWKDDVIQRTLPDITSVDSLSSLEVRGARGTWACPNTRHVVGVAHISPWLGQVESLPQLERLTLSDVALYSDQGQLDQWPELPNLRYLRLNRPLWPHLGIPELFNQIKGGLKTLHISGIFEALDDHDAFYAFLQYSFTATSVFSSSLEELILICPGILLPHFPRQFASWYMHDLSHLTSLKYLHLSSCLFHVNLLLRAPVSLETLVIDIHPFRNRHSDLDFFRQEGKFDLEELMGALVAITSTYHPDSWTGKSNIKTVILEVEGETMEEGWDYLADKCKTFWFEEGQCRSASVCACEYDEPDGCGSYIGMGGGLDGGIAVMSYVDAMRKEIRKKSLLVGVEIRLELKRSGCQAHAAHCEYLRYTPSSTASSSSRA